MLISKLYLCPLLCICGVCPYSIRARVVLICHCTIPFQLFWCYYMAFGSINKCWSLTPYEHHLKPISPICHYMKLRARIADKAVINGILLDIAYNVNLHAKRAMDVCFYEQFWSGVLFLWHQVSWLIGHYQIFPICVLVAELDSQMVFCLLM